MGAHVGEPKDLDSLDEKLRWVDAQVRSVSNQFMKTGPRYDVGREFLHDIAAIQQVVADVRSDLRKL